MPLGLGEGLSVVLPRGGLTAGLGVARLPAAGEGLGVGFLLLFWNANAAIPIKLSVKIPVRIKFFTSGSPRGAGPAISPHRAGRKNACDYVPPAGSKESSKVTYAGFSSSTIRSIKLLY